MHEIKTKNYITLCMGNVIHVNSIKLYVISLEPNCDKTFQTARIEYFFKSEYEGSKTFCVDVIQK